MGISAFLLDKWRHYHSQVMLVIPIFYLHLGVVMDSLRVLTEKASVVLKCYMYCINNTICLFEYNGFC